VSADTNNELTIVRVLNAPREQVWRACREADALRQWWGMPEGAVMPFCEVDFRVGGTLHFATRRGERPLMWFKCLYREIVEGERLVLEQHLSDEHGSERDSLEWPGSTITLRLEDMEGKTKLTVVHAGMASRRATIEDYRQGWSETLDRLADCLDHR
jgi:uncharacterized protein YndB with AHSA1/START domain